MSAANQSVNQSADRQLRELFLEFTDLLVGEFDLRDYLSRLVRRCVDLLGVDDAGILVLDETGELDVAAAFGEPAELLGRFELAYDEGAGLEAFRSGHWVECPDLATVSRWPRFVQVARECGVVAAHALPCRLREATVGALTLYSATTGCVAADRVKIGRALANTVSLGLSAHRGRALEIRAGQLQDALHSRVLLEQAKGVLAERMNVSVDDAFTALRGHARRTGTKLTEVARAVLVGELTITAS